MKILVVVPSLASYIFLRELCLVLARRGDEVHFATSWTNLGSFEMDTDEIEFHSIEFPRGMNPLAHIRAAGKLNTIVRDVQPDIIDVHFSAAAFTCALAKKSNWPPVLVTVQGLRFPLATGVNKWILQFAERWSSTRVDQFLVLTEDDLLALKNIGVTNCIQQPGYGFGCDLARFDRDSIPEKRKRVMASKIGKSKEDVVMVFVGRLVAFKGFHLVVRAFLEAYTENRNIRLLVCGTYDDHHDSGLTNKEKEIVESHKNIHMAGWIDNIYEYLAIADFVVFPSEREGVPVNLMEALAMGVPVITCDSRGCREVMNSATHGILLPERSVDALADAIRIMVNDEVFRMSCANSALQFRGEFDRMNFVENHVQRLDSMPVV